MISKEIKWGIMGCGKIAGKFAQDLALVPDCILSSVASRNPQNAEIFKQKHGAKYACNHYNELLNKEHVDIIYIASPHSLHYEQSLACLEYGIPVLCEKPMGVNTYQVQKMVNAAKEKKLFFAEALWTLHLPNIKNLFHSIQSGIIGKVKHIHANFAFNTEYNPESRLFDPKLAGGSLLDIGIYPLLISKFILGQPTGLKAFATKAPSGVDMRCTIAATFASGATATLFSALDMHAETNCIIYGEKGQIEIPSRFIEQDHYNLKLNGQASVTYNSPKIGKGYYYEISEANDSLRNGRMESQTVSHQFSVELMEIMDEVRKQIGLVYPIEGG